MLKARPSVYEGTLKHEAGRGKLRLSRQKISSPSRQGILDIVLAMDLYIQVHGASCADRSCVEVEVAVLGFPS